MKYIKLFKNHSEYETFVESDEYIEPHVSYCTDEEPTDRQYCVQYNKEAEPVGRSISVDGNADDVEPGNNVLEYGIKDLSGNILWKASREDNSSPWTYSDTGFICPEDGKVLSYDDYANNIRVIGMPDDIDIWDPSSSSYIIPESISQVRLWYPIV